jgi:hypothetical protein
VNKLDTFVFEMTAIKVITVCDLWRKVLEKAMIYLFRKAGL